MHRIRDAATWARHTIAPVDADGLSKSVLVPAWFEHYFAVMYVSYGVGGIVAIIHGVPGITRVTEPWYVHVYGTLLVAGALFCCIAYARTWIFRETFGLVSLFFLDLVYLGSQTILANGPSGDALSTRAFLVAALVRLATMPCLRFLILANKAIERDRRERARQAAAIAAKLDEEDRNAAEER
jgi:hypothetical protein